MRLSIFLKLFVSTVTVPPSDSDYVNRSASLQQFDLFTDAEPDDRVARGWSIYSASGIGLQASAHGQDFCPKNKHENEGEKMKLSLKKEVSALYIWLILQHTTNQKR